MEQSDIHLIAIIALIYAVASVAITAFHFGLMIGLRNGHYHTPKHPAVRDPSTGRFKKLPANIGEPACPSS